MRASFFSFLHRCSFVAAAIGWFPDADRRLAALRVPTHPCAVSPSRANSTATARPMPESPPVITAATPCPVLLALLRALARAGRAAVARIGLIW